MITRAGMNAISLPARRLVASAHSLDLLAGDRGAVLASQQVFENDLQREGQAIEGPSAACSADKRKISKVRLPTRKAEREPNESAMA